MVDAGRPPRIRARLRGADFIAGIEIGFGQSLDKLAATLAMDPHDSRVTDGTDSSTK
ncbi:hypothetical protein [Streptomyces sp. BA2]|uniref:hypothetical protein n=1 Tax=Streptomyces sp. BA2 TaxID=436595 RepID=UPI0030149F47